jgi:SAM-dependent methyltransferase
MVDALSEIHRVLMPDGILIDMRPLADRWRVEVISGRGFEETGRADDLPDQLNADTASNGAMQEAETRGWFKRELEEFFPFFYVWDTPSEMEEFISEEWTDFAELREEVKKSTRSAWALGDADTQVRIRVKVLISSWKKL